MCILFRYWEVYALSLHKNRRVSEWLIRVVACGIRLRSLTPLNTLQLQPHPILGAVNGDCHILADFFGKPRRQLTPGIELPAAYKVWQIVLALMVQTMEKEIFTVESKSLCCYAESYDLEVRELWDNLTSGHISEFIHTISGEILADTENSDEICYEVAHKQNNSSW